MLNSYYIIVPFAFDLFSLHGNSVKPMLFFFIFWMSKVRYREVRKLAHGHRVGLELKHPAPYYFVFLEMELSSSPLYGKLVGQRRI